MIEISMELDLEAAAALLGISTNTEQERLKLRRTLSDRLVEIYTSIVMGVLNPCLGDSYQKSRMSAVFLDVAVNCPLLRIQILDMDNEWGGDENLDLVMETLTKTMESWRWKPTTGEMISIRDKVEVVFLSRTHES